MTDTNGYEKYDIRDIAQELNINPADVKATLTEIRAWLAAHAPDKPDPIIELGPNIYIQAGFLSALRKAREL